MKLSKSERRTHVVAVAPLIQPEEDLGVLAVVLDVREEEVADAARLLG